MFDNMTGAVGFAIHEDRLATAAKNLQLADAKQGRQGSPSEARPVYRVGIAAALVALATQIAPTIAVAGGRTRLLQR